MTAIGNFAYVILAGVAILVAGLLYWKGRSDQKSKDVVGEKIRDIRAAEKRGDVAYVLKDLDAEAKKGDKIE